MPDELSRFQIMGPSWAERAKLGELNAVLSPTGTPIRNTFLHKINLFGAQKALTFRRERGVLIDFGCGTGRFTRFFAKAGYSVIGTEITPEMVEEARKFGLPANAKLELTDGIHIPVPDASVDLIWVCGVLRLSLLVPDPVYKNIAQEMYRCLKPGACVINLEMYVENPPETFTKDFEDVGFQTQKVRVLQRYASLPERFFQNASFPLWLVAIGARLCAFSRYYFDSPYRVYPGLRDYLFVWVKPKGI